MATCGEVLVEMLGNYGIDTVFGIPGVHTVELYRGLAHSGLNHVTPRHEQGAGFMADGYARASGKVAACFVITGPGVTNIATPMGQALADSIPMLVISSVNARRELGMGEGRLHELDHQRNLMAGVARFSHTLLDARDLPVVLARAFAVFQSARPGPVHIEIPVDVIASRADDVDRRAAVLPSAPGPAPDAIRAAAVLMREAQRPLIVVGGGAVDAGDVLLTLSESLDAPVINTVNAKGVLPYGHALAVGGSASHTLVRDELRAADVVLAVGTEFGETDYDFFFAGPVQLDGALIRVDIDAAQLMRNVRADIAIVSDARLAIEALNAELAGAAGGDGRGKERARRLRERLETVRERGYAEFFAAIRRALPDVTIVGDSTQPTYDAWLHYETDAPRRYFHSASGFGTLGYAIPAAIGAQLAVPERPVIALIGDGGAQFTIGELSSAVEAGVPVIFIVWNNTGFEEIKRFMVDREITPIGVDTWTPDFIALAQGFGCAATRVDSPDGLIDALRAATTGSNPTLIEVTEHAFITAD